MTTHSRTAAGIAFVVFAVVFAGVSSVARAGSQTVSLYSPSNGRNVNFVVYTPPDYATSARAYPMVLDLHGIGGSSINRGNQQIIPYLDAAIRAGSVQPMIYVFGDGQTSPQSASFWGDAFDGHKQVYSNVIEEVLPYVDANYRTVGDRRFRAVQGFSMGGFGAMMYATKRPDLFSAGVGYSGAYQNWARLQPNAKVPMYNSVETNFTPYSVYDQTLLNAQTIAGLNVRFRMLIGGNDTLLNVNQSYNQYLNNILMPLGVANIPLEVVPGIGHDGKRMFETGIGLQFLNQHFTHTPGDADADGDIDFSDLTALARNYNLTGRSWIHGDFDYDGNVGFADLLALARNYNISLSPTNASALSGVGGEAFMNDWLRATALVPEPVTISLLTGTALLLGRKRRSSSGRAM